MASKQSDVFDQVKDEYMARIFEEIRADAQNRGSGRELQAVDAFRAFEDYFGGLKPEGARSAAGFLQDHLFLLSAMFLTLVFGAFGLYHPDDQDVASFLDIAKIFAGAAVGGAAGSSIASAAGGRGRGRGGGAAD